MKQTGHVDQQQARRVVPNVKSAQLEEEFLVMSWEENKEIVSHMRVEFCWQDVVKAPLCRLSEEELIHMETRMQTPKQTRQLRQLIVFWTAIEMFIWCFTAFIPLFLSSTTVLLLIVAGR